MMSIIEIIMFVIIKWVFAGNNNYEKTKIMKSEIDFFNNIIT